MASRQLPRGDDAQVAPAAPMKMASIMPASRRDDPIPPRRSAFRPDDRIDPQSPERRPMTRFHGAVLAAALIASAPARADDKDATPILDKAIKALGGEP